MRDLLRFITCGSVDDGKSTLIGRLLYDLRGLAVDHLDALAADSRRMGTQGAGLDFALLVDGLSAEREQGITIDVAYRYFASARRDFIVADTPGHEQYTRNMATGASTADLAVILVDARIGMSTQTRRHSRIVRLMGIERVVLAVNKLDLIGYDQTRFAAIVADYGRFAKTLGLAVQAVPLAALTGENVVAPAAVAMPWYAGPTLLDLLEAAPAGREGAETGPFRMPVQLAVRPDPDFRGFAGLIARGSIAPGDAVRILPAGRTTQVARIVTEAGDLASAQAGQAVTLTLTDPVDCSRGDVIAVANDPPPVADQFEATLIWFDDAVLLTGRSYLLKLATRQVPAQVQRIKYVLDVDTGEHLAATVLGMNAIGVVTLATDAPIVFDAYADDPVLGGFILIDQATNATVAAGMLHFALRRSQNVHPQSITVDRAVRADRKGQRAAVIWLTGLSGAGKSTIANLVEERLVALGRHTFLLDGDNVRHGLNRDLGFTDADRIENIRRVAEVARLMSDAGLIVIVAFISPFRAERTLARALAAAGEFVEVFVDTPLADAEARDVKGLYAKARAGQLANFTGIDSPYEAPVDPELRIDTTITSADAAAELIVARVLSRP